MLNKKYYTRNNFSEKFKKFIYIFSILIIIVFLIISNLKINQKISNINKTVSQWEQKLKTLEERNQQLKAGIDQSLQSDYEEEILREKGMFKKKGENMVIVLTPQQEKSGAQQPVKNLLDQILETLKLKN